MTNISSPDHEGEPALDLTSRDQLAELPELLPIVERGLTQESVDELRQILQADCGVTLSNDDAWESARNLVRFGALLVDLSVEQERREAGLPSRPVVQAMTPPVPASPPPPRAFPIALNADHEHDVRSNLILLEHELSRVKTYPSSWRWAVVAAYNALGHALILRHRDMPKDPLHHLLELFDLVAQDVPAIKTSRPAIERLEILRTTWVTRAVTEWPIPRKELASVLDQCRQEVERLSNSAAKT